MAVFCKPAIMLRTSVFLMCVFCALSSNAQVFWSEDFGNIPGCNSQTADGFNSGLGQWTVVQVDPGANSVQPNVWYVSATEAGMGEGNCGEGCLDTPGLSNASLHVSTDLLGDLGAAYFETGFGFTDTDIRAQSPIIDCSGQAEITMSFLYMAGGNNDDFCSIQYFDGMTWSDLGTLPQTALTCAPQGIWTAFSVALPASADNNPNVRIGFRWINVDDGIATDPSVAIDDIELFTGAPPPPPDIFADFTSSETIVCAGDCVEFTDLSDGPVTGWTWTFEGGTPGSSNQQSPADVCYDNPGTYAVTLEVTGPGGANDVLTIPGFIEVEACGLPPQASFTASSTDICAGECVDFTDTSLGDDITSWTWGFTGANPNNSNQQNPTNVCYDTPGTYAVSLSVSSAFGDDSTTENAFITVSDCSDPPEAAFSSNVQNICAGDCVNFTDQSTGNITDWQWTFTGAETANSTNQNPNNICYNTPGSYSVTLVVTGPDGNDQTTVNNFIVVDDCSAPPTAAFSSNVQNICIGDCVNFNDQSTGSVNTWQWTFDGADTQNSNNQNPGNICYSNEGTFAVTLLVTGDDGDDEVTVNGYITVADCAGPQAGFTASELVICEGDCIDFINQSIGGATDFEWSFPGADTPSSTDANPTEICYQSAGQYEVTLEASDGVETDILTQPAFITVEECLPEPAPPVQIGSSTTLICLGDCVSFTDLTEGNTSNWSWSFPGAVPSFSTVQNPPQVCYLNEGSFDVTLELTVDGEITDSTFSNFITVVDTCGPIANFNYTPIVCLGQCYDFENTSTGGTSYFWTFEGAATPTSEMENPTDICYLDQTGIYNVTLTVTNQFGSSTSITQQITVVNPPNVNAGPDQTIVQGTSTTLTAVAGNGTGNFVWQPFEDVLCFSCPSTVTYPLNETTTFIVFYEQSGGCQSSDTVTVFVEESYVVGVPNSFSPNGDGVNDVLFVRGNNITRMRFVVYNRYGQKVFETNDQSVGWDGTMGGRELNAGVFGYYLEVFQLDGNQQIIKGDITLVR
ncbi:MAG: PKD domain-containing protein [Cryomorphaceae bacterium]|nr:MAG: PKD domain-containing protein [Cryomorphaceae bacterium]